jgi:nucleolar protein 14
VVVCARAAAHNTADSRRLPRLQGAARELRKDNRFLAEERTRVLQADAAEREGKYRAAMSFLEQQEADFKSGGQGGAAKKKRRA